MRSRVAVNEPEEVNSRYMLRAVWLVFPSVSVNVVLASEAKLTTAYPVIAFSNTFSKALLVVVPQDPLCSPAPMSSTFKLLEKVLITLVRVN